MFVGSRSESILIEAFTALEHEITIARQQLFPQEPWEENVAKERSAYFDFDVIFLVVVVVMVLR